MDDENNYPSCQHQYPDCPDPLGWDDEEHAQRHLNQTQDDDKNSPRTVKHFPYLAIQGFLLSFLDVRTPMKQPRKQTWIAFPYNDSVNPAHVLPYEGKLRLVTLLYNFCARNVQLLHASCNENACLWCCFLTRVHSYVKRKTMLHCRACAVPTIVSASQKWKEGERSEDSSLYP